MDEQLQRLIYRCKALGQQLEDDYEQLSPYLKGDIFEAYREEVQAEQQLLERMIRRIHEM